MVQISMIFNCILINGYGIEVQDGDPWDKWKNEINIKDFSQTYFLEIVPGCRAELYNQAEASILNDLRDRDHIPESLRQIEVSGLCMRKEGAMERKRERHKHRQREIQRSVRGPIEALVHIWAWAKNQHKAIEWTILRAHARL